jgi:hypothetical protein
MWASPQSLSGDQGELVVGDMNGNITVFKSIGLRSERNDIIDFRRVSKVRIRKLGITHILMLYGHNLMITAGYDNTGIVFANNNLIIQLLIISFQ